MKEDKQEVQEIEGISGLDASILITENCPGPAWEREATPDADEEMPFRKLPSYGPVCLTQKNVWKETRKSEGIWGCSLATGTTILCRGMSERRLLFHSFSRCSLNAFRVPDTETSVDPNDTVWGQEPQLRQEMSVLLHHQCHEGRLSAKTHQARIPHL